MNSKFNQILDECIQALKDGASIDECVAKYPEAAQKLKPLLMMAAELKKAAPPQISVEMRRASEQRMIEAFHVKEKNSPVSKRAFLRYTQQSPVEKEQPVVRKEIKQMKPKVSLLIAGLLVTVIVATTGVTAASANALPGDALYPVKNAADRVQMFFTFSESSKEELEAQQRTEHFEDVLSVMDDERDVDVEFYGTISEVGEDYIIVDGIRVEFTQETMMPETLRTGMVVEVEGHVQAESILAYKISVESDAFGTEDMDMPDDGDDLSDDDSSDDMNDDSSDDEYDDDSSDDMNDDSSDDEYDDSSDDMEDDSSDDEYDDSSDDESDDSSDDSSSDDDYEEHDEEDESDS